MTGQLTAADPDRVFQTYRDGSLTELALDLAADDRFTREPYASVTVFSAGDTEVFLYDDLQLAEVRTDTDPDLETGPVYDLTEYGFEHDQTTWYDGSGHELISWEDDPSAYQPAP